MSGKVNIFWFRRDLRVDDNVGFYKALHGKFPVLPIFIFDTEILNELQKIIWTVKVKIRRGEKDPGETKRVINFVTGPFRFVRMGAKECEKKMWSIRERKK